MPTPDYKAALLWVLKQTSLYSVVGGNLQVNDPGCGCCAGDSYYAGGLGKDEVQAALDSLIPELP